MANKSIIPTMKSGKSGWGILKDLTESPQKAASALRKLPKFEPPQEQASLAFYNKANELLAETVVNWLSLGQSELLEEWADEVREVLLENQGTLKSHHQASARERNLIFAYNLRTIVTRQLSKKSLATMLAFLSGRRASWIPAIQHMARTKALISSSDLINRGYFNNSSNAFQALAKLVAEGLVQRSQIGSNVRYGLTWDGVKAARHLKAQSEESSEGFYFVKTTMRMRVVKLSASVPIEFDFHKIEHQEGQRMEYSLPQRSSLSPEFFVFHAELKMMSFARTKASCVGPKFNTKGS